MMIIFQHCTGDCRMMIRDDMDDIQSMIRSVNPAPGHSKSPSPASRQWQVARAADPSGQSPSSSRAVHWRDGPTAAVCREDRMKTASSGTERVPTFTRKWPCNRFIASHACAGVPTQYDVRSPRPPQAQLRSLARHAPDLERLSETYKTLTPCLFYIKLWQGYGICYRGCPQHSPSPSSTLILLPAPLN